jgi:choice-of-anchor C domain-containing protein
MRTKVALLAVLLGMATTFAVGVGAPAPPKQVNLLVNGSFEEGPEPGKFISLNAGATDIKGWTVINGQIDYVGTFWESADGKRSLDLHGSPGVGGVKQAFKTTVGQKYRVTFSLAANPETSSPTLEKTIAVAAAGRKETFTFDAKGKAVDKMGWETKTWEFVAEAKETTLELYSVTPNDQVAGPALDNVSVVELAR